MSVMFNKVNIFFIILFITIIFIIIGLNVNKLTNSNNKEYYTTVADAQDIHNYDDIKKEVIAKHDNISFDDSKISKEEAASNPEKFLAAEIGHPKTIYPGMRPFLKKFPQDNASDNHVFSDKLNVPLHDASKKQKSESKPLTHPMEGSRSKPTYPRIIYPDKKTIDHQLEGKTYITSQDFGFEAPHQYVGCANSSLGQQWKKEKKNLIPHFMPCHQPNFLTSENYHKTRGYKHIAPIEDYHIRGSNYMDFMNKPTPYTIDMRILSHRVSGLPTDKANRIYTPTKFSRVLLPGVIKRVPTFIPQAYNVHNAPVVKLP